MRPGRCAFIVFPLGYTWQRLNHSGVLRRPIAPVHPSSEGSRGGTAKQYPCNSWAEVYSFVYDTCNREDGLKTRNAREPWTRKGSEVEIKRQRDTCLVQYFSNIKLSTGVPGDLEEKVPTCFRQTALGIWIG